jgi:uncharacterized membrane protein YbaN (DUF454 family)
MTRQRIWRVARIASGVTLVVLGILGLFLPFLQGFLFLAIGLTLLTRESPRLRNLLRRLRDRLPHRVSRSLDALRHGRLGDTR